jgi:FKBP-type peptidyl-prolyl cis-trans isomerase FkpA
VALITAASVLGATSRWDNIMRETQIAVGLILVGLLSSAVGCSLPRKNVNPFKFSETKRAALVHQGPPITSFDKEALLNDTGPIDEDAPEEFSETNSGLKYRILRKSNGIKPNAGNTVSVHYRGWLDNGTEFDSSYKRGESISFPLNGVIAGWTEGMQLIGTGGMVELWIPSSLGYGAQGAGADVPPHATLHFIVELIDVK